MNKLNKFADKAALLKEIASIKVAGAKLDARIQDAAVAVLCHFGDARGREDMANNRDNGLVNRLYLALPAGARKQAMASWLLKHCAVVANTDRLTKAEQPFIYDAKKHTDPEGAAQDPWYNHKPDPAPDAIFDVQAEVRRLLAKAAKAPGLKNGDTDALKALAKAVGIPDSDVTTKHAAAAKVGEALM